jgi:hypothetical protein
LNVFIIQNRITNIILINTPNNIYQVMNGIHLILDMDGTLVNMSAQARPYLKEFLCFCFANFASVNIWTAASKEWYCTVHDKVFQNILEDNKFGFVWTSDRITRKTVASIEEFYPQRMSVKRLKKVWRQSKTINKYNTLIIDDTHTTYQENYGNAIPIPTFEKDMMDTYLIRLIEWLPVFNKHPIRSMEKRSWDDKDDELDCIDGNE